jgi:hypothetical protein
VSARGVERRKRKKKKNGDNADKPRGLAEERRKRKRKKKKRGTMLTSRVGERKREERNRAGENDPMPILAKLPNLSVLINSYTGKEMVVSPSGGFPKLGTLKLRGYLIWRHGQ